MSDNFAERLVNSAWRSSPSIWHDDARAATVAVLRALEDSEGEWLMIHSPTRLSDLADEIERNTDA